MAVGVWSTNVNSDVGIAAMVFLEVRYRAEFIHKGLGNCSLVTAKICAWGFCAMFSRLWTVKALHVAKPGIDSFRGC
jgi:hypothetical protein